MLQRLLATIFLVAAATCPTTSRAQLNDPCGCNAGLAPLVFTSTVDDRVQLEYFKQIDERQFEQIKKSGGLSGTYMAVISGSANYAQFNEKRSQLVSKESFKLNVSQSMSLVLNTVNTAEWGNCKRQCIQSQSGFVCDVSAVTATHVGASCSWKPQEAATPRSVNTVANGIQQPTQPIQPNALASWQIRRDPAVDLMLTFTLVPGPSNPPLIVSAIPTVPPAPPEAVQLGSCIGRGGQNGVTLWGPLGEFCNGLPPWGPYQTTGSPQPAQMCSCVGRRGFLGVRLWGPQGAPCGGIPNWGKYDQQCVPVAQMTLCGCYGQGNVLNGHVLWGPQGSTCGGIADWKSTYAQFCKAPK